MMGQFPDQLDLSFRNNGSSATPCAYNSIAEKCAGVSRLLEGSQGFLLHASRTSASLGGRVDSYIDV